MSYAPPVGGFPTPQPAPAAPRAAALPGLAALLILVLLLDLAILAFDLNRAGTGYLSTAFGINYDHFVAGAPIGYSSGNAASDLALIVLIVGAFSGGGWVRPAGATLLLVNAYGCLMDAVAQLTGNSTARDAFASPVQPNLLLNLDVIAQAVLALVFGLIVAATMRRGGSTGAPAPLGYAPPFAPQPFTQQPFTPPQPGTPAQGYGAPVPPQPGTPQPAPGYTPPVQPPTAPPVYGYPPHPQDAPPAPPTA
ncbi:hypothetical protein OG455_29635 [Kitasatospora sp. NBC_01287]|uniref:hypothetical protein n=1 Tax=Kitasatospora sp. NBC_01287 TaxID=2903573 RepID=UPI0022555D12|nr:hypothetical protein [Kitasatospora sp. NBC_01287]MCX4749626.1 hypothetical protein [Kitasatospora sp. NBC_01287]